LRVEHNRQKLLTKLLANRAFSNEHKFYGKVSFENNAASNKLLDVRREQRLYYHVVFLLSACVLSVPAHVNAAVGLLPLQISATKINNEKPI
jgi:hypothetical protein